LDRRRGQSRRRGRRGRRGRKGRIGEGKIFNVERDGGGGREDLKGDRFFSLEGVFVKIRGQVDV